MGHGFHSYVKQPEGVCFLNLESVSVRIRESNGELTGLKQPSLGAGDPAWFASVRFIGLVDGKFDGGSTMVAPAIFP